MSTKYYSMVAAAIRATQDRIEGEKVNGDLAQSRNQLRGVRRTATHISETFAENNPNFDQVRFLKQCGYGA